MKGNVAGEKSLGEEGSAADGAFEARVFDMLDVDVVDEVVFVVGNKGAQGLWAFRPGLGGQGCQVKVPQDDVKGSLGLLFSLFVWFDHFVCVCFVCFFKVETDPLITDWLKGSEINGLLRGLEHLHGIRELHKVIQARVRPLDKHAKLTGKRLPISLGVNPARNIVVKILNFGGGGDQFVYFVSKRLEDLLQPPVHPFDPEEPRGVTNDI